MSGIPLSPGTRLYTKEGRHYSNAIVRSVHEQAMFMEKPITVYTVELDSGNLMRWTREELEKHFYLSLHKADFPPPPPLAQPDKPQPKKVVNTKVNLCDACLEEIPSCPAVVGDVSYGDGFGDDNIIKCKHFTPAVVDEALKEPYGNVFRRALINHKPNKIPKKVPTTEELLEACPPIFNCAQGRHVVDYGIADNMLKRYPMKPAVCFCVHCNVKVFVTENLAVPPTRRLVVTPFQTVDECHHKKVISRMIQCTFPKSVPFVLTDRCPDCKMTLRVRYKKDGAVLGTYTWELLSTSV